MSFNIQGHGPGSSEHHFGNVKYKNQIAAIIHQSGASIVLLQEVRLKSENDISPLLDSLNRKGGNWKAVTSVNYYDCTSDLNNAVLYDEKVVLFIEDYAKKLNFLAYKYDKSNGIEDDCRTYQFDKNHEQVLKFKFPKNSSNTFFVVNVHAPRPDNREELKKEKEQIEKLYRYYKRESIIIGGDFNMHRRELFPSSAFGDAIVDGDRSIFEDENFLRTTLSSNKKIYLANDYDHFIVKGNGVFSVSEKMHHVFSVRKRESYDSIKIGGTVYKTSDEYRNAISDHLPIMIKLKF